MRVLLTGGSGVIGEGLIPHLLERGHTVRLLTRGASQAAREWPDEVESFAADVTRPEQLVGAADGCDVVVHLTGIIDESPPEVTFQTVNVEGTRHLLIESARAGLPKFIFMSSLGAERGTSEYQASKREAERLVRTYGGSWVILRAGSVYGPYDEVISKLLSMHRTLPAIPIVGTGDHPFQPIWYLDLGRAVVHAIERHIDSGVYEIAGNEVTTPNAILDRFETLTDRKPARIPLPEVLTGLSTSVAHAAGVELPLNDAQFRMLIEENIVKPPERNALTRVFGVSPTPLNQGLAALVDIQPEQTPDEGIGGMERKRFWADVSDSAHTPESLMDEFRRRCTEIMPIEFDAEPGTPQEVIEGATLTAALPMRGNVQIRVAEAQPRVVTFATLRGHPLAGIVRFTTSEVAAGVLRFSVHVFARSATVFDWMAMTAGGAVAQNATWRTVVERMVAVSGGASDGVHQDTEIVHGEEGEQIEAWISELITAHKRRAHERQATKS